MAASLPIESRRAELLQMLDRAGCLVLSAPTGSGKSTGTPRFLLGRVKGRILVLEPRRLSARSLAARVASEAGAQLGGRVGYQVRFDDKTGKDTECVFQTYGVFARRLQEDPELRGVGAVLLDEFHERALECDLALAWLKALRAGKRPDLKVVVMSATLDAGELERYLPGAARLDVPGRMFPVEVRHRPCGPREFVDAAAADAVRGLWREGLDGSVLVFMPGLREIRRTITALGPFCRENGLALLPLHGSMEPEEQQRALDPAAGPRVIVSTNVAETGLTIPGVTAVVDSGLHRLASYDAARGVNALYLSRISKANAAQRTGRAGRTAPGRCVRLWSMQEEAGMAPSLSPEIQRLELSTLALDAAALPGTLDWLTPPKPASWDAARSSLRALGALTESGAPTEVGRALLRYPAHPRLAAVLEAARALGPAVYERACAMAAVFESAGERPPGKPADLYELAGALLRGEREEVNWEASETLRQLRRIGSRGASKAPAGGDAPESALAQAWLRAFADRLGARERTGQSYRLADGRTVFLPVEKDPPAAALALDVRERAGGGQARQTSVALYLPVAPETVEAAFKGECAWTEVSEFDPQLKRVVKEQRLVFRGLALERREVTPPKADRKVNAELWAEQFATGELRHPGSGDEKLQQLLTRVALARKLFPDYGFPEMAADDWRLIYGEVCAGKNSLKDIERVELAPHVASYVGRPLMEFLDKALPVSRKMPSGKSGRYTYFESKPAELSARLGDFLGMTGTLSLCDGKLPVLFDILAPHYRTVQKTPDLASFWANTYPEVKKELKRRYPRHPWP